MDTKKIIMKVSIITIVYNNKSSIAEAIKSVLSQSYTNIEYIIVDGGSTDGTQEAIKPYFNRISVFKSEKDKGLYDGLNKGIKLATGDIVGILHSDDLFYSTDTIEKVVKAFQESEADIVYANGQYIESDNPEKVKRIYRSKKFKSRYLPFGWIPLHTTIYARREIFEQYGLYEDQFRIAGDYEISLRWFRNPNIKKHFLNEWVVKMRLGGKSTTAKLQKKKSSEDLQIIRRYKLWGCFTLACKIGRKIPQYLLPRLVKYN
jgi:glycosyltransferase